MVLYSATAATAVCSSFTWSRILLRGPRFPRDAQGLANQAVALNLPPKIVIGSRIAVKMT